MLHEEMSESVHKMLVLITSAQKPPINAHADVTNRARVLNFSLRLHLHAYFVCEQQRLLRVCSDSHLHSLPEPSLLHNETRTKISSLVYGLDFLSQKYTHRKKG